MEEKTPLLYKLCAFGDLKIKIKYWGLEVKFTNIFVRNYFFLKKSLLQRELFLTMLYYYQQLSFTRYQVLGFYADNYFE